MTMRWPETSHGPCPTVLLWHDMPPESDVASHVDWLLAMEPAGTSPLKTFRLKRSLCELPIGAELIAEPIGDHRPAYLTYEGPVSGNRGSVRRLASGHVLAVRDGRGGGVELDLLWAVFGQRASSGGVGQQHDAQPSASSGPRLAPHSQEPTFDDPGESMTVSLVPLSSGLWTVSCVA